MLACRAPRPCMAAVEFKLWSLATAGVLRCLLPVRAASNVGWVVREIKIVPIDSQTKVWCRCYKCWYMPVGMMLTPHWHAATRQNTDKNLVCNTYRDHYYCLANLLRLTRMLPGVGIQWHGNTGRTGRMCNYLALSLDCLNCRVAVTVAPDESSIYERITYNRLNVGYRPTCLRTLILPSNLAVALLSPSVDATHGTTYNAKCPELHKSKDLIN